MKTITVRFYDNELSMQLLGEVTYEDVPADYNLDYMRAAADAPSAANFMTVSGTDMPDTHDITLASGDGELIPARAS